MTAIDTLVLLLIAAITYGTPLLYGTLGEILTEKSGNLNLGVEGIMFMGGAIGLGGVFYFEQLTGISSYPLAVLIALLAAFLAGAAASLIFSFLTITLRTNQNVTGLALAIFGTGVGQFAGEMMRIRVGGYVSLSLKLNRMRRSLRQKPRWPSLSRRHFRFWTRSSSSHRQGTTRSPSICRRATCSRRRRSSGS